MSLIVKPISGALGADIHGVDLSKELDSRTLAEVKEIFHQRLVIFFRDQQLTPEALVRFAAHFGPLDKHPLVSTLPDHPYVAPLIRDADAGATLNFGGTWHSDVTFKEAPPLGSMLYGINVPPYGGDTMFSNLYLAYDTLSPELKRIAEQIVVIHSAAGAYDADHGAADPRRSRIAQKGMKFEPLDMDEVRKETEHPLVCIHPETGRKLLYTGGAYVIRFKGWSEEQTRPMLQMFRQHASRPEFTCRFRWETGSLAFWDNRATLHFAVNDYPGFRREMHRVQIGGQRLFGPAMPRNATTTDHLAEAA